MSIEKIEIEFRALIGPDAETLADGVRLGALIRTGHALLDELSRLRRLEHAVQFTAKMAWREDPPNANQKLTDEERLSAIKWHPTVKDLGQAFLSEREGQE